jgi:hypothetical protein
MFDHDFARVGEALGARYKGSSREVNERSGVASHLSLVEVPRAPGRRMVTPCFGAARRAARGDFDKCRVHPFAIFHGFLSAPESRAQILIEIGNRCSSLSLQHSPTTRHCKTLPWDEVARGAQTLLTDRGQNRQTSARYRTSAFATSIACGGPSSHAREGEEHPSSNSGGLRRSRARRYRPRVVRSEQ